MIIVKIELHSAITHEVTLLGQLRIINDGTGSSCIGNYHVELYGKNPSVLKRDGRVLKHRRKELSVFYLVAKALKSLGIKEH